MKKVIFFLNLLILCFIITSCGKNSVKDIKGTYELSLYTYDYYKTDIPDKDIMKEKGIKAYLIITGNEYGYAIYSDKEREIDAKEVFLTYKYDSNNSLKGVEYSLEISELNYGIPGGYKESLSFDDEKLTSKWSDEDSKGGYYRKITYKKINNNITLESLENKLGYKIKTISYLMYKMNASFILEVPRASQDMNPYVYFVYKIDGYNKKVQIYYALKEDNVDVILNDIDISYKKEDGIYTYLINNDELTYVSAFPSYLYNFESSCAYYRNRDLDVSEYINEIKDNL